MSRYKLGLVSFLDVRGQRLVSSRSKEYLKKLKLILMFCIHLYNKLRNSFVKGQGKSPRSQQSQQNNSKSMDGFS